VTYQTESQFEAYIRQLIRDHVTSRDKSIYALKNKKAVDIIICKDVPEPQLFFIEVKFHKPNHGRLGFGGGKGGGFQPEIMTRQPAYFEKNLRWVLASETHQSGKVLFLSSSTLRNYVSGGSVEEKFNNIQEKLFREQQGLTEQGLVRKLRRWFGVKDAQPLIAADQPQAAGG
jgi:hypothetical protein